MLLDRRTFAAGSAALLTGCATTGVGTRTVSDCTPLAPVEADPSRLIRAVAGLRPAEAVVDLAHENAIALQEGHLHAALADLGDLNDEEVQHDRDDDREGECLDDLEERAPREGCLL